MTGGRTLAVCAVLAAGVACSAPPTLPDPQDLTGTWIGSVPRVLFVDDMRLELVQSGRSLSGQGVRGRPCPADGTCYADVTVVGTLSGARVTLRFGPWGDAFVGEVRPDGTLEGVLTAYGDAPVLSLRRIRE
jgi:hypothetical protein